MMEVTASGLVTQRFLHGMQASQLDVLAETALEVMFPSGHRIFADGDYADKFWLIQSGCVALDVLVPGEGQVVIGRVGLGGLVGWSWLLPPYKWAFGAVTATAVQAFEFDAPTVRKLCAADPGLGYEFNQRVTRVLATRLQATRIRLITRSGYSAAVH